MRDVFLFFFFIYASYAVSYLNYKFDAQIQCEKYIYSMMNA